MVLRSSIPFDRTGSRETADSLPDLPPLPAQSDEAPRRKDTILRKWVGFSLPRSEATLIRNHAVAIGSTSAEVLRSWAEPHLQQLREAQTPDDA